MPSKGLTAEGFASLASDPLVFIKVNVSGAWNYNNPALPGFQNTEQESPIAGHSLLPFPRPPGYS